MKIKNLPKNIAVFPLSNAVFFPGTILPLNIFENRYLELVKDCMKKDRYFGMVQPKSKISKVAGVYQVGCLGKIVSFNETVDKRFVISLSGIIRFNITSELDNEKLYREFNVDYSKFKNDLENTSKNISYIDKDNILKKIKLFFNKINYSVEFNELSKLNFDQLVSTVCMVAPFSAEEKQKLIETVEIEDKVKILEEILNFCLLDIEENRTIQ
jgi:Lon protease-like protein|tara:strand:- start:227 stop:865 length:639 start_codon:yes stop_codon:yes gene_type:complete